MQERMKITDEITVGAQPTEGQLRTLSQDGYKTVVNLRASRRGPTAFAGIRGREGAGAGHEVCAYPLSSQNMNSEQLGAFRRKLPPCASR